MMNEKRPSAHDVGGRDAGPIDRAEHEMTFWEWRIDAMVRLLFEKNILVDWAELRRAIEALDPETYDTLSYYERWASAVKMLMLEKGVLTTEELDARIAKLKGAQG